MAPLRLKFKPEFYLAKLRSNLKSDSKLLGVEPDTLTETTLLPFLASLCVTGHFAAILCMKT